VTVDLTAWTGLLAGRTDPPVTPTIVLPIAPSTAGGSGTFLAADEAGQRWWVKPLNNQQGPVVTVTESIVATAGALIGAPTCQAAVVRLPAEIAGWSFRAGATIEPGFAHASAAVPDAVEDRRLLHRLSDDNARRHAGVLAIYDWCWGGDDQWLYSVSRDSQLFSHDHGWYLPDVGPTWDRASLEAAVDLPHELSGDRVGLDVVEVARLSQRLRTLTRQELIDTLSMIPASWPVPDTDLEALGWFLERRSALVAERLDVLRGLLP